MFSKIALGFLRALKLHVKPSKTYSRNPPYLYLFEQEFLPTIQFVYFSSDFFSFLTVKKSPSRIHNKTVEKKKTNVFREIVPGTNKKSLQGLHKILHIFYQMFSTNYLK